MQAAVERPGTGDMLQPLQSVTETRKIPVAIRAGAIVSQEVGVTHDVEVANDAAGFEQCGAIRQEIVRFITAQGNLQHVQPPFRTRKRIDGWGYRRWVDPRLVEDAVVRQVSPQRQVGITGANQRIGDVEPCITGMAFYITLAAEHVCIVIEIIKAEADSRASAADRT